MSDERQNKLHVWHWPNCPSSVRMFYVPVNSVDEAIIVLSALADYDNFHGDAVVFTNAQGLEVYLDGEWVEFYDDKGRTIEEINQDRIDDDAAGVS